MTRWNFRLVLVGAALAIQLLGHATLVAAGQRDTRPAPTGSVEASQAAGVDAVVTLLRAKMSEALILKTIQNGGAAYELAPADVVKLQQAGASERIIEAMMAPSSAAPAAPTPPSRPLAAPGRTPEAPASPPAAASTDAEKPKRGSLFGRAAERLKAAAGRSADKALTSAEASVEKAIDGASSAVDEAVDDELGVVEDKTDATTKKVTGEPSERERPRR
jgi:hypothetical protein